MQTDATWFVRCLPGACAVCLAGSRTGYRVLVLITRVGEVANATITAGRVRLAGVAVRVFWIERVLGPQPLTNEAILAILVFA